MTCLVCDRHAGATEVPGGVIHQDPLMFVGHAFIPEDRERV